MFDNLIKGSRATGLHIEIVSETEYIYTCSFLKRQNKKIFNQGASVVSEEEFLEKAPKDVPLIINISGKGIIFKKVPEESLEKDLQAAFPGLDPNEFYLQRYQGKNSAFLCIIRKSIVDGIVEKFIDKYNIVHIILGVFSVDAIIPFLYAEPGIIHFEDYRIKIEEASVSAIEVTPKGSLGAGNVMVGEEAISSETVLAYSSAFYYFMPSQHLVLPAVPRVQESAENYVEKAKFQTLAKVSLIFIFLILLINYLLFDKFYSKQKMLEEKMQLYSAQFSQLESLKSKYEKQSSFFQRYGLLEKSKFAVYGDQLAKELPIEIRLTSMQLNPLIRKTQEDSVPEFTPKRIVIAGNCEESRYLNQWIGKIKKLSWVEAVQIKSYSQNGKAELAEFILGIDTK